MVEENHLGFFLLLVNKLLLLLNFRSSEPGNSYRLGSYKKSPDLVDDNQKQTKYKKIKVRKCE